MGRRPRKTPQQKLWKRLNTRACQGLGLALMIFLWWMMGGPEGAWSGLLTSSIPGAVQEKAPSPGPTPHTAMATCRVREVIDGDTFTCDLDGDGRISRPQEYVRLLGIDAPETHFSEKNKTGRDEPFSQEAKARLKAWVEGQDVTLESDLNPYDRYGRRLAYVYLGNTIDTPSKIKPETTVNARMLRQGLVTTLFFIPNRRHEVLYQLEQAKAQQDGLGLWGTAQSLH